MNTALDKRLKKAIEVLDGSETPTVSSPKK
jgi:hypothetical protein